MTPSSYPGTNTYDGHTDLVRQHLHPTLRVVAARPLTGGMVNKVECWDTDGDPAHIVVKRTGTPHSGGFFHEFDVLQWYAEKTSFPVPRAYACVPDAFGGAEACLLMEYIDAPSLGSARLTERGASVFEEDLARHLTELHGHRRATYGSALEAQGPSRFLDLFRPAISSEVEAVSRYFTPSEQRTVDRLLAGLEEWLPEAGEPRLTHGDLWATNILVDDSDPNRPCIRAFIDVGAAYRDVEHELAYLLIFNTAGQRFFEAYQQNYPLRPGFEQRCRIYWLNTWMLHVRMFGESYLPPMRGTLAELAAWIG